MNAKTLRWLVVLNVVLVVGLVLLGYTPHPVSAQLGGRGEYVILSGDATGLRKERDVIYIVDVRQQRLAALTFDTRNGKLEQIDARDISKDLRGGAR